MPYVNDLIRGLPGLIRDQIRKILTTDHVRSPCDPPIGRGFPAFVKNI